MIGRKEAAAWEVPSPNVRQSSKLGKALLFLALPQRAKTLCGLLKPTNGLKGFSTENADPQPEAIVPLPLQGPADPACRRGTGYVYFLSGSLAWEPPLVGGEEAEPKRVWRALDGVWGLCKFKVYLRRVSISQVTSYKLLQALT